MFTGFRGLIVALGLALCAVFAAAFVFGSWLAYGVAALCALGASFACALLLPQIDRKLDQAVSDIGEGVSPSDALGSDGKDSLSRSLSALAELMDKSRAESEFYGATVRGAGYPAFTCGVDGRIQIVSKPLVDMLKKPVSQVVGFTVSQAFYNKSGDSLTEKAVKSGRSEAVSTELTLWDGRTIPVKVYVDLIHDAEGAIVGASGSFFDITDMAEQQKQLDTQRDNMAQAGKQLSGLAEHVASATELLSASADDQAQGAQKQRVQTSSVATAMEQMTGTVLAVAQNAAATSEAADQASTSAGEGVTMVTKAVSAINEVADSADQLGREVGELDTQAEEIGRIISVINDIADQTNLLALNAAIEAARAGEAGRGFAVVADEVRKLAEKTVAATKEVEEAIGTIQKKSRNAVDSMRQTEKQVISSTELSNQAGNALQQIMESIQDMVGRVAQIATAAEEQSAAAEEINRSVDDIAEIASDADEAAGQAASATRDLAGLAQELLDVSRDFTQGGESRLRESDSNMKGILPKLTQEFVKKTYGPDIYEGMQDELGHPVFLSTDSYPDQVLMQMAELVSSLVGTTIRNFFLDLGRFTVVKFHQMYPGYFKEESLKEFYLRMNDVHAQLTKDQPGIKPPNFTYEDKGDDLFMNYRSHRGLFDYFEGILLGAADFKGERVTIQVKPFDDTTARAEIVFHGKR